jgi:hypothetical protein
VVRQLVYYGLELVTMPYTSSPPIENGLAFPDDFLDETVSALDLISTQFATKYPF